MTALAVSDLAVVVGGNRGDLQMLVLPPPPTEPPRAKDDGDAAASSQGAASVPQANVTQVRRVSTSQ